ncbi:uncharacterized protein RAG0_10734 [Rhynchosporium agropyri]|uniref:Uncharacterized protein n=1 Tax=Rhynchosporium agropyri TaxID=914238 RepID=A0A1E1L3N3_9HELO|nr:uncharacterized protein RAG0_10734 [Rhynchosporium agropyri]
MSFDTWVIAMLGLKNLEAFKGARLIYKSDSLARLIQSHVKDLVSLKNANLKFRWYSQAIAVRTSYIKHAREHMADVRSI